MNSKQLFFIWMCLFYLLLSGCKETVVEDDSLKAVDYYPLEVGRYLIYNVDSIIYNETIADDTTNWQIKEEITDTFYDDAQRLNFVLERSRRLSDTLSWQIEYIWSVLDNDGNIEKTENNLKFIRLISPVRLYETWDGTIYLSDLDSIPVERECDKLSFLEDWTNEYISVDSSMVINGLNFDNTLTVLQQGEDNFLALNYAKEVYAKGVGMVQKEFYHFTDDDLDCLDCTWDDHVECGYKVIMRVVEYN